jgi:hypothetical protein
MRLSALRHSLAILVVISGSETIFAQIPKFVLFRTESAAGETRPPDPQTFPGVHSRTPAGSTTVGTPKTLRYTPLTNGEKWRYYWRSTYNSVSFLRIAATSGISQAQNDNPEWGQGMEGYGKRFASKLGHRIVRRSIHHGLGALLNEDPRYLPSGDTGFFPRVSYAVSRTFIVRTDDGGERFAYARTVSVFAGAFISRTWHPESDRTVRSAMESAAISLGVSMGLNIFKEYWRDVRRFILR